MSNCQAIQLNPSHNCGCGSKKDILQKARKQLTIDFMYIDLEVCTRCKGTEENLSSAIADVANLLTTTGYDVTVNNILIESEEQAKALQFVSSPTIRINGRDIQLSVIEKNCDSCGTITGSNVDCRVWDYEDKEYTEAPKSLIINAILKEVYGTSPKSDRGKEEQYAVPENLKRFFAAKREIQKQDSCSSNDKSVKCC